MDDCGALSWKLSELKNVSEYVGFGVRDCYTFLVKMAVPVFNIYIPCFWVLVPFELKMSWYCPTSGWAFSSMNLRWYTMPVKPLLIDHSSLQKSSVPLKREFLQGSFGSMVTVAPSSPGSFSRTVQGSALFTTGILTWKSFIWFCSGTPLINLPLGNKVSSARWEKGYL